MRYRVDDPTRKTNLAAAVASYQKCLGLHKQNLHEDHLAAADVQSRLGDVHLALGEGEAAVKCFDAALRAQKNALGDDHWATQGTRNKRVEANDLFVEDLRHG